MAVASHGGYRGRMSLQEMNLTTFDRRALMRGSAVLLLAIVVSCDAPSTQLPPQTLPELAAAWSGGRSDPVCQNRGPNGEYLGTSPGAQYCQWPTVARGPEWGTVGGHRDSIAGLGLITWERSFRDSSGSSTTATRL